MRMKSRKALDLCIECRKRLMIELSSFAILKSPNYKIMSDAVGIILNLNIAALLSLSPEKVQEGINKLKHLKSLVVPDDGYFSKPFVTANINIMLKCLRAGVIPDSNIWIGTDQESEEALRRLSNEIEL